MTKLSMPVTVVMTRRAREDHGPELVAWAEALCTTAATFPGHLSHAVHETTPGGGATEVAVGLSFAGSEDLVRWERSDARAAALEAGGELTEGTPTPLTLEEMDARLWGKPERAASSVSSVSRWRAAGVVWLGLFPPAVLVNLALEPFTTGWPVVLRTLLLTVVLVPVVVLGTVPLINRALFACRRPGPQGVS
jgi:antibiotic biosynthesis monooxygenase (ABM) superfamily enzyme